MIDLDFAIANSLEAGKREASLTLQGSPDRFHSTMGRSVGVPETATEAGIPSNSAFPSSLNLTKMTKGLREDMLPLSTQICSA